MCHCLLATDHLSCGIWQMADGTWLKCGCARLHGLMLSSCMTWGRMMSLINKHARFEHATHSIHSYLAIHINLPQTLLKPKMSHLHPFKLLIPSQLPCTHGKHMVEGLSRAMIVAEKTTCTLSRFAQLMICQAHEAPATLQAILGWWSFFHQGQIISPFLSCFCSESRRQGVY